MVCRERRGAREARAAGEREMRDDDNNIMYVKYLHRYPNPQLSSEIFTT